LLRLSTVGLTKEDQAQLRELARQAIDGSDVTELARQIASRPSASPLAVAVASLVERGFGDKKMVLLGALFGVYSALSNRNETHILQAATAGALAASALEFTRKVRAESRAWRDLVDRE